MSLYAVAFIYLVLCFLSYRKFGRILNPYILETYIIFLMIPFPQILKLFLAIDDKTSLLSDLVILTYLVFSYFGTSINLKAVKLKEIVNIQVVNTVNWFFFFVFLAPLLPIFLSFNLSIAGIRMFYETVVFSKYASFFELSKYFIYVILIYRMVRLNKLSWSIWIWTPFFFLYGSKFVVFDFFMLLLLFLEYYRGIRIRRFAYYAVMIASILIVYRVLQQTGNVQNVTEVALSYFDQYKNQTILVEKLVEGEHSYYYGELYFSSYLKYIPRFLWEDKPRAFGFAILNWDLMPKEAAAGYMPAFGLASTFADFGFFSVALVAFMGGLIKRYLYNMWVKAPNNLTFYLFALPFNFISIIIVFMNLYIDRYVTLLRNARSSSNDESRSSLPS